MFYSSVKSKNIQLIEQANRIVVTKGPRGDGEKLINGHKVSHSQRRGNAGVILRRDYHRWKYSVTLYPQHLQKDSKCSYHKEM